MQYAPHDSNPKSLLTPSHLHMPSMKNRRGRPASDPYSKTKSFFFCFVILDTLDTPMLTYFLTQYCVLCIYKPRISGFSPQDAARLYNILFYLKQWTVSDYHLYFKSIGQFPITVLFKNSEQPPINVLFKNIGQSPINCFIQKQWTVSDKHFIQKHWTISDKLFYSKNLDNLQ